MPEQPSVPMTPTERTAAWRIANPEKTKAQRDRYRAKYKERRKVDALARYHRLMAEDPERVRKLRREWAKTDKGAIAGRLARHGRRGAAPSAEAKAFAPVLLADPCSYCGGPGGELDHIDPITRDGDGGFDNFTSACRTCNARKSDQTLLAFLAA